LGSAKKHGEENMDVEQKLRTRQLASVFTSVEIMGSCRKAKKIVRNLFFGFRAQTKKEKD
jgi:hypothetical protein